MTDPRVHEITALLRSWRQGDGAALDEAVEALSSRDMRQQT